MRFTQVDFEARPTATRIASLSNLVPYEARGRACSQSPLCRRDGPLSSSIVRLVYVCVHTYVYVYIGPIYVYMSMFVCVCIHRYVYMYVCMYMCMYTMLIRIYKSVNQCMYV